MKADIFCDAIQSSAKVLGRRAVRTIFAGDQALTDGDTIILPALPAMAEVRDDDAMIIRGYRDHEAGHVRCTDTSPNGMERLRNIGQKDKLLFSLSQYCEDARIEHAMVQEYVGAKSGFAAMEWACSGKIMAQIEGRMKATGATLEQVVAAMPRETMLHVTLQAESRRALDMEPGHYARIADAIKRADPDLHALGRKWGQEMAKLPTGFNEKTGQLDADESKLHTEDSFALAEKIAAEFRAAPPPPPQPQQPQPQPQQGESSDGEPEDGEGEGGGEGEQQSEDASGSDGQGEEGDEPDGDSGSGDSESDGQGDGSGAADVETGAGDGGGAGEKGGNDADDPKAGDSSGESADAGGDGHGDSGSNTTNSGESALGGSESDPDQPPLDVEMPDRNAVLNEAALEIRERQPKSIGKAYGTPWLRTYNDAYSILKLDKEPTWHIATLAEKRLLSIREATSGKASMIRRLLELQLQARFDRMWEGGKRHGRLSSSRLVDAVQGRENVFQLRQDGRDMDTFLRVCIDGSGSMDGGPIFQAACLSYALCEALERTGCEIEIDVWDDNPLVAERPNDKRFNQIIRDQGMKNRDLGFSVVRQGTIDHRTMVGSTASGVLVTRIIKDRKSLVRDPRVAKRFGIMCMNDGAGTPLVDAVTRALGEVLREKHGKRILLVLTDGETGGASGSEKLQMELLHQIADTHGVHLIGVGIGIDVSKHFRDHVQVNHSDMYEKVIRRVAAYLAEERKKVWRAAA